MMSEKEFTDMAAELRVAAVRSAADVAIEAEETDAWLQRRLQALPPMQHQVLRLRQIELKDNAEIAAILGIKPASVATLLSKARRQLLADIRKRNQRT